MWSQVYNDYFHYTIALYIVASTPNVHFEDEILYMYFCLPFEKKYNAWCVKADM